MLSTGVITLVVTPLNDLLRDTPIVSGVITPVIEKVNKSHKPPSRGLWKKCTLSEGEVLGLPGIMIRISIPHIGSYRVNINTVHVMDSKALPKAS